MRYFFSNVNILVKLFFFLKFDTVIEPDQYAHALTTLVLFECTREIETQYFSNHSQLQGEFCYKSENFRPTRWDDVVSSYCTRMSLVYQAGGYRVTEIQIN